MGKIEPFFVNVLSDFFRDQGGDVVTALHSLPNLGGRDVHGQKVNLMQTALKSTQFLLQGDGRLQRTAGALGNSQFDVFKNFLPVIPAAKIMQLVAA